MTFCHAQIYSGKQQIHLFIHARIHYYCPIAQLALKHWKDKTQLILLKALNETNNFSQKVKIHCGSNVFLLHPTLKGTANLPMSKRWQHEKPLLIEVQGKKKFVPAVWQWWVEIQLPWHAKAPWRLKGGVLYFIVNCSGYHAMHIHTCSGSAWALTDVPVSQPH